LVGIVGRQRTLRSPFVKGEQAEEDGKRVLDYLIVALIGFIQVPAAGAANQIPIERQLDLAHCHGNGANRSQCEPLRNCARRVSVAR
jgi:hypothetical protein